jgi:hypothetical protein
MKEVAPLGNLL